MCLVGPLLWAILATELDGIVVVAAALVAGSAAAWMSWSVATLLSALARSYAEQLERQHAPRAE